MPSIIIVDDSSDIVSAMELTLQMVGFEVLGVAGNGQDGIDLYKATSPDMVLLDVQMPVMSGRKALRTLLKENPDAFVVMLTATSNMEVVDDCLDAGARHYVMKDDAQKVAVRVMEIWEEHASTNA